MAKTSNLFNVRQRFATTNGIGFVRAESPQVKSRQHIRIIGGMEWDEIGGQTLLYADSYTADEQEIFLYVRHKCSQETFFTELNFFTEDLMREMSELRNKKFNVIFNISGEILSDTLSFPIRPAPEFIENIRFFRVDFPFGALTIEFGKESHATDQLKLLQRSVLSSTLDAPLVGCDVTDGLIFSKLIVRLHWASDTVPPEVLETLIAQVAHNPVVA